jgi:hypothetical protein
MNEDVERNLSRFLLGVIIGLVIITIFKSPYLFKEYDNHHVYFHPVRAYWYQHMDDAGGK